MLFFPNNFKFCAVKKNYYTLLKKTDKTKQKKLYKNFED